ncbi:MAG: hypothetical protein KA022_01520 [Candidatus Omnitrophica bacterium]|jgi:hypothetical protein|nr:hypothetical protein [Candidatus Omnitrophota bacterium]MDD5505857.1 hypothetical protein [Candidatus Omnitrophota bacterium]
MRKILLTGLLLFFAVSSAFALEIDDSLVLNGVIIDVQSAGKNKDNLDGFLTTYTKTEALMPEAIASGYGIFLQDGYMKFDNESNAKIAEFLSQSESTLEVTVKASTGVGKDDILELHSIQNK